MDKKYGISILYVTSLVVSPTRYTDEGRCMFPFHSMRLEETHSKKLFVVCEPLLFLDVVNPIQFLTLLCDQTCSYTYSNRRGKRNIFQLRHRFYVLLPYLTGLVDCTIGYFHVYWVRQFKAYGITTIVYTLYLVSAPVFFPLMRLANNVTFTFLFILACRL